MPCGLVHLACGGRTALRPFVAAVRLVRSGRGAVTGPDRSCSVVVAWGQEPHHATARCCTVRGPTRPSPSTSSLRGRNRNMPPRPDKVATCHRGLRLGLTAPPSPEQGVDVARPGARNFAAGLRHGHDFLRTRVESVARHASSGARSRRLRPPPGWTGRRSPGCVEESPDPRHRKACSDFLSNGWTMFRDGHGVAPKPAEVGAQVALQEKIR